MDNHDTNNAMTYESVVELVGILMAISITAREWARDLANAVDLRQPEKGEDDGKECKNDTGR